MLNRLFRRDETKVEEKRTTLQRSLTVTRDVLKIHQTMLGEQRLFQLNDNLLPPIV